MKYLLALDQGTSSSRAIIFNQLGQIVSQSQIELKQLFPKPNWVEHDPMEIWRSQLKTAQEALKKSGLTANQITASGITNQRETTVVWNKVTGKPIYNAIVWQDRRTEPLCVELRESGLSDQIRQKTGLLVDAYFSATKLKWILDEVPGAREDALRGNLLFGTIDTWLMWNFTGGKKHETDVSNASRTMLFDIRTGKWDLDLLQKLNIPASMMPNVRPSMFDFGAIEAEHLGSAIPIFGVAGDQQSALFGQACFERGMAKNTYGTGCFMLLHTGAECQTLSDPLLVSRGAQTNSTAQYVREGSVFVGGAVVQWLRDGLGAIQSSSEVEKLAKSVPNSGGVVLVPSFTGLGAPYWVPDAKGTLTGLTRGTNIAHIARAALESIGFQSAALLRVMSKSKNEDEGLQVKELRVDGGASINNFLMQFQADLLGIPVIRPEVVETTALGVAFLAGLAAGVFKDLEEITTLWRKERVFLPEITREQATESMEKWDYAVKQATHGLV